SHPVVQQRAAVGISDVRALAAHQDLRRVGGVLVVAARIGVGAAGDHPVQALAVALAHASICSSRDSTRMSSCRVWGKVPRPWAAARKLSTSATYMASPMFWW